MAIVFGLETPKVLAKSDIWIPKCTKGGSPVWDFFLNFPNLFLVASLKAAQQSGRVRNAHSLSPKNLPWMFANLSVFALVAGTWGTSQWLHQGPFDRKHKWWPSLKISLKLGGQNKLEKDKHAFWILDPSVSTLGSKYFLCYEKAVETLQKCHLSSKFFLSQRKVFWVITRPRRSCPQASERRLGSHP